MERIPSVAAQIIITIIPIVAIVMGCLVIFFYLLWHHKRNVMLIKAGHYQKPNFNVYTFSLLTGLLLFSVGLTLTVFLSLLSGFNYSLLGGVIPLSIGIGMLSYCGIRRGERRT